MSSSPEAGPLIMQSDKTLLLEVDHPAAGLARAAIAPFAELERAPEHVHTYRVTPLALWNARAAGHDAEQVVDALVRFSRYAVPQPLLVDVVDTMGRYGRLQLVAHPTHGLALVAILGPESYSLIVDLSDAARMRRAFSSSETHPIHSTPGMSRPRSASASGPSPATHNRASRSSPENASRSTPSPLRGS